MADGVPKQSVKEILGDFSSLENAKELFSELNYDIARDSLSRQNWSNSAKEALAEDPQVIATHGDFRIIYGKLTSDRLLITPQRAVINTLLREHPYALFLFSNEDEKLWHFVNVKLATEQEDERNKEPKKRRLFRRITIRKNERRLRTAIDRVSMLDLAVIQPELFGIPPLTIQSQHDAAFDVEAVTKEFYADYVKVFRQLQASLESQTKDSQWAHDYALQCLNRTMFLYFVQRKGWLADDSEFLETFWNTYNKSGEPEDKFFEKWLKVLFFEAFNNRKNLLNTAQRAYLPEEIRKALWDAPYLNGGLFKENKLDTKYDFSILDRQFRSIFNVFQHYNFTISEDSPLDQEVAVDPEVIGKVYEGLVNVSENVDERGEAGIFYTPRTEIDLMCRLSIVDNLANHLGEQHKNLFYELVFSLDQDEKEQADKALSEAKLWPDVEKRLNEITILDPACGSGSFLVGMLYVLGDLLERAEKQRGQLSDNYKRKKNIIGQSLYGVDVMDWACHVAELRLWLSLIVDAEFTKEELTIREEPLLPHFSFKVRCGDSLVQEVGGVDMAHRRGVIELSQNMKRRLRELKNEKSKFYTSDKTGKFKFPEALEQQEVLVFRELLQDRIKAIDSQAKKLMRVQAEEQAYQQRSLLTGELEGPSKQFTLERERREKQITALKEETKSLEVVLNSIRSRATVPFVWDISFAEIMESDNHGFDIVIGNPPYVRQEKIADPKLSQEEVTVENKKEYKAKLARSVYKECPSFFKYKTATDKATHKLDAKSDLYIYFYFHGLSLLSDKGSFCFITSNSWLDVGYGKDLQEFLLKRCHAKLVIDNKAKRSFKSADVNTVIVLFGAPADTKTSDDVSLEKTARFAMFYVPFEEALHPVVFEEIEEFKQKTTRPEYRVFPIKQAQLLTDGCEIPKETEEKQSRGPLIKTTKYIGNKWGGKYLRAPDIYWTILEKGKDKLVRLGDVAKVRFGIKTGANEFFYLTDDKIREWQIEPSFLQPVIISPRECESIAVADSRLENMAFVCHIAKSELIGTKALKYIEWGESQGFNQRASCKGRNLWYDLGARTPAKVLWSMIHNDRLGVYLNPKKVLVDHNLFEIVSDSNLQIWASLFWIGQVIFRELFGRANLGQGALKTEGQDIKQLMVVDPGVFSSRDLGIIKSTVKIIAQRAVRSIGEEVGITNMKSKLHPLADRAPLDNIIFDAIGLTNSEREEVYRTAYELVAKRLMKADSLRTKG